MFITGGPGTKLCAGELEREGHVLRDTVTHSGWQPEPEATSPGRGGPGPTGGVSIGRDCSFCGNLELLCAVTAARASHLATSESSS